MKCKYCGSELQEGQRFCPSCGTLVEQAPASYQQENSQSEGGQYEYDEFNGREYNYGEPGTGDSGDPFGSSQYNYGSYNNDSYNNNQYNQGQYNNGTYPGGQPVKPVNGTTYLVFAILATVLCCIPLGIPAIIYASKINSLQSSGDYEGARDAAKKAKIFTIISAVLCVIFSAFYMFAVVAGGVISLSDIQNITTSSVQEEQDDYDDDREMEEPKEKIVPAEPSSELGENWNSYTVQVNDKVLTLPCTIADLETAGVTLDVEYTPEDYVVNADEYVIAYFEDGNENELMVHMVNTESTVKTIKECLIGGISVDEFSLDEGGMTVLFPGGIQLGMGKADVIAKYGETEDIYEGDTLHMYTWTDAENYYKNCEIDFDADSELVTSMTMMAYQ